MASDPGAEPDAEDAAEAEEGVYEEVMPCDRMELSQRLAVEELITTEASYVHNIQLCVSDIRAHLQKKQLPDLDLEGLFSNTDDILHMSKRFLKGLEDTTTATSEHEQLFCISTLFQEFKEEMETTYKIYCASYEHALLLVPAAEATASFSLFFLVMPVQRVTKYPLLLGKILENTPPNTSVYSALEAAVRAMAQVNTNINEYKRRKEVATKYNKAEHLTLRDRFARLNTHSIAKKTSRLSRLFMHEAGIVAKVGSPAPRCLHPRARCRSSGCLCGFPRCPSSRMGERSRVRWPMLTPSGLCCHERYSPIGSGAPDPSSQARVGGMQVHTSLPKQRLDKLVCQPLCSLSDMLVGPQQLVKKRLDKLLDYEEIQERRSEMGSVTYDEEAAMNTYLAINALLVAELPRFNQAALQLLGQILCSLSTLQWDLAAEVLHQAEKELEQMPHGRMPLPSFWKMVEDTLQQSGAQLHAFQQTFETVTPSPVAQPLNPAEERKVLSLMSKHGPDKLYQVTSNISGSRDLDLTLQRGQVVALLQSVDTKGNTNRWLVDAGGPRGFVPAGKLQPYCPAQSQQPGMQMLTLESGTERRRHSYAPPAAPRPRVPTFTPTSQVVAGFSFAARSPQEVTLQAGQPVVVLEPHDKKGNKEWSLVEVNGQKGYVPSSYLVTIPEQEPTGWSLPV
uniref:Rho guanine nucleotide exchange factor 37 n=1 Tax=Amazona collaria TaxID=241587 RepID=A0A8B9F6X2_9PSIT